MSSPSLSAELLQYNISEEEFDLKKQSLKKKFKKAKKTLTDEDVIWAIFKKMTRSITHYESLQMLYENMASFQDSRGNASFKWQQKAKQCSLLELKKQGKTKVKIAATSCCLACGKLHNKVLGIKKALIFLPIPNAQCENTLASVHLWCNARYAPARDEEAESEPPPPAAPSVPTPPELAEVSHLSQYDPSEEEDSDSEELFSESSSKSTTKAASDSQAASSSGASFAVPQAFKEFLLPIASIALGLGASVFSLGAGIALGITGFLGILLSFPKISSAFHLKWPSFKPQRLKFILYGLGLFAAILILLLSYFPNLKSPQSKIKKVAPPPYRVVLIQEQSSATRTRLKVHIVAPQAMTARERANIVMQAAQDMQRSQFPSSASGSYQYVDVILEADEKQLQRGFVVAEAEYAPDGAGKRGQVSNSPQSKWKWNVKVSHQRVNLKDPASLDSLPESLQPYLKQ